ncbi:type IV pilin protein [Candidatus Methylocalor cossyra]|uniref:Type IV pilus biogenesis protein PilE n=1 Tax=Candidatus Methylocalor cossyra TaxID=3108543 RepID=A0ABM9NLJ2_9GAMM
MAHRTRPDQYRRAPRPREVTQAGAGNRRAQGFTLLELMVALGVVGILAGVAYPAYLESVRRSARDEVKGILLEDAQFLERNYTTANRYDQDSQGKAVALPYTASPKAGTAKYTITVDFTKPAPCPTAGQCFTLKATPTGAMAGDRCGTFTLTSTGTQGLVGAKPGVTVQECWQR